MTTVTGVNGNQSFATAQNLDGLFTIESDPNVDGSDLIPHVTVNAVAEGGLDYYSFTLTTAATVNFDIDNGMPDVDPYIRILDANLSFVGQNDDGQVLDPGSLNGWDSNLTVSLAPGTYYLVVGEYPDLDPLNQGQNYTLHISTTGAVSIITNGDSGGTIAGTPGNDWIDARGGNDTVNAGAGNDRITGGTGRDRVNAGTGDDTIIATNGDGGDVYDGGTGSDTLDMSAITASIAVNLASTRGSGPSASSSQTGTDALTSIENFIGGSGNDTISGTDGINRLDGGGGNDTIKAGQGNDIVIGGAGNDTMNGDAGSDVFKFTAGFGIDRIEGFDANPSGGQDYLNVSAFGITSGNFAARVKITDVGADTLVTIDNDPAQTIRLVGIGNITTVTEADFVLLTNHAPTGVPDTDTGTSVDEDVGAGFQVADLNATDVDGDTISYYLKDGNGNHVQTDGNFNIDAITGVVTTARAFDFETDGASLSLTAFAGDGNGGENSGTYTVPVGNVAENNAPTGIPDTGTGTSVDENVAAGFQVADLNATDVDGDTISYYLKDGNGNHVQTDGNFNIDAITGVVTTARAFDFETDGTSLSFTAFAGDGNGGEDSGTYTVPIGNVVTEPQIVDFEDTTDSSPLPSGYAGFNWEASNSPFTTGSDIEVYGGHVGGYNIAPDNAIGWNAFGAKDVVISHINGNFDLISMDLINGYYDSHGNNIGANQLLITAYDDNVQEQQVTIILPLPGDPLATYAFNWDDIDAIKIEVVGGLFGSPYSSGWWGMDNLTLS